MTAIRTAHSRVVCGAALLLVASCGEALESAEPHQVVGSELEFPTARRRLRRELPAAERAVDQPNRDRTPHQRAGTTALLVGADDQDWPTKPEPGKIRFIEVDLERGLEWELEYDLAELDAISTAVQTLGLTSASPDHIPVQSSEPELPSEPEAGPQGWSGSSDNRVKKNISATYPSNEPDLRRIGTLLAPNGTPRCSGVMIGRRLVLTAAHCVLTESLSDWDRTFAPRRDNSTKPYGEETAIGYIYPYDYLVEQCHVTRTYDCTQYDWAVLRLPESAFGSTPSQSPLPATHPGYMGYYIPCTAYINENAVLFNNGYPVAENFIGAPAGMFAAGLPIPSEKYRIYGNVGATTAGAFTDLLSGVPRRWDVGGDWSGGHSGSGVYAEKGCAAGPENGPYVLGVASAEYCRGLCDDDPTWEDPANAPRANLARGMASDLSSQISYWRSIYP